MRFERKVKGCTSVVRQARRAALAAVSGVAGTAVRGVFGAFVVSALGVLVGVLVLVGGLIGGAALKVSDFKGIIDAFNA